MLRRAFLKACAAVAICFTDLLPDLAPKEPWAPETVRIQTAVDLATGWATDFCVDRDGVTHVLRFYQHPFPPAILGADDATRRLWVIPKRPRKCPAPT